MNLSKVAASSRDRSNNLAGAIKQVDLSNSDLFRCELTVGPVFVRVAKEFYRASFSHSRQPLIVAERA